MHSVRFKCILYIDAYKTDDLMEISMHSVRFKCVLYIDAYKTDDLMELNYLALILKSPLMNMIKSANMIFK
jgi:hypothetical protein